MSLIDPSVAALPTGSLFSFGTPCLKWKLVGGFKTHWGYPGYDGTISPPNRYLTKTIVYTAIGTGPDGDSSSTTTSVFNVDQYSGVVTSDPPGAGDIENLPQPAPVTYTGDTVKTADTGVQQYSGGFTSRQIFQVTLSNPYTMAMLEADVDALIAGFNPDSVASQTITGLFYPVDDVPIAALDAVTLIGSPYAYPILAYRNGTVSQSSLGAAAIAAYDPAQFAQDFGTMGFGKVVSFLAMAGDYCLKTYTLNPAGQFIGSPTCISGRGSCGSWFKVSPPTPFVPSQNTFVLAVPNCQCGN